jgi:hypothetical protein
MALIAYHKIFNRKGGEIKYLYEKIAALEARVAALEAKSGA